MPSVKRDGFAQRLRASTRADHQRSRATPFVQALLAGEIDAEGYALLLTQQYFVHAALERAAEQMRCDTVAGPFVCDQLRRLPALEADLRYFLGRDWRSLSHPNTATERYVRRLGQVCFDWPGGFVAHHYTRYFGDLSDVQILRTALSRYLHLCDGGGVDFLTFPRIPNGPRFMDEYRARLDVAGWSIAEQNRIIAEARNAYELNTLMLVELGLRFAPHIPAQRGC